MQSLDRLDIDTPEQIALELPLAGIGSRFLALAIDSVLQVISMFVLFLVGAMFASSVEFVTDARTKEPVAGMVEQGVPGGGCGKSFGSAYVEREAQLRS